jgi:non-ribosomal peptide synthetase component F
MSWSEQDTASSIPERFEQQVRLGPERPAIGAGGETLTYAQLATVADGYAGHLPARTAETERVALLLNHDGRLLAAALAALRRGLTVVTLNPGDPPPRLARIREAAAPQLLITEECHRAHARAAGFADDQTLDLSSMPAAQSAVAPAPVTVPDDIAFLICTSGSSGLPKVVMQSHRNMLHNVLRYSNGLAVRSDDRLAWLASLSGGQGLATAWTALLNGACLCPFSIAQRGVTGLADWLRDNRVTVFDTIPSVLRSFGQTLRAERIAGVRLVRLASEGAVRSDFEIFQRHFSDEATLASVLASSEAGIIAQALLDPGSELADGRLPVGRPVEGLEAVLLDEHGSAVNDGEAGELILEGRFLSPGYWRDEVLTAARFETWDGTRRFRSGDIARRDAGGSLTVLGRADKQVKVRGNRLQLEEVEAALVAQVDVAAAAVVLRENSRGDAKLTAYVAAVQGRELRSEALRRTLGEVLSPHAVPAAFVFVDQLPLNANGKVDREQLTGLDPAEPPLGSSESVSPSASPAAASETEDVLAGLWSEALDCQVGPHDAFLELGGDSLSAAVIAAGVHEAFGVDLDLRAFASDLTLATLAALVDRRRTAGVEDDLPPLRRAPRTGPLSSSQARMWQPGAISETQARWHVAVPFQIRGPLDVGVLRESIQQIVHRHEILRTTFTEQDGQPIAIVGPGAPVALAVDDLRAEPDPAARSEEILESELHVPYDLESGPLLRWRLLRFGAQEYRLLRMSHHLIHDALSWRIFFRELALIYPALRDGRPSPLADEPELQYFDYALWERACLRPDSERYRSEIAWWQRQFDPPAPPLALPFARAEPDPDAQSSDGVLRWGIPAAHSDTLDRIGRRAGATYFMTRLAAFCALLALETGQRDIVIGTPVSTRIRAELQNMIGPFLNFGVLRLRFPEDPSFHGWLGEVRRAVIDTGSRVTIPWEQLMPELRGRDVQIPMIPARFVAWSALGPMRLGDVELEPLPRRCAESWGFRLGVNRPYETDRCWTEFDPRIHDPVAVRAFLARLQTLVAAVCAEPDRSLRDLHSAAALI